MLRPGIRVNVNEPGHAHFLTFSCQQRLPLLNRDRSRQWFVNSLNDARTKLEFEIWAYVIMPEHVHLLLWPMCKEYEIQTIRAAIKRSVSSNAKSFLIENCHDEWLKRLTVQKGTKAEFRFWQKGPGYDENLWTDRPIMEVIDYIHANPVRRELVERTTDWYWSSARFYESGDEDPLKIDHPKL